MDKRDIEVIDGIITRLQAFNTGNTDKPYVDIDCKGASDKICSLAKEVDNMLRDSFTSVEDIDALTGIASGESGIKSLEKALQNKSNYPICVCYLDIDGVKKVNEKLGHSSGDAYIKSVADAIIQTTRKGDIISRLDEDEFLIVLLKKERDLAEYVLSRVYLTLSEIGMGMNVEFDMDFSYGVEEIERPSTLRAKDYVSKAEGSMRKHKERKRI